MVGSRGFFAADSEGGRAGERASGLRDVFVRSRFLTAGAVAVAAADDDTDDDGGGGDDEDGFSSSFFFVL